MLRAVVVGRARGVLEEYEAACAMCTFDATIVIGKMAEIFPGPIDHWVSFHADLFPTWLARRRNNGLPDPTQCWGATFRGKTILVRAGVLPLPLKFINTVGGSSGFMGAQVALDEVKADRTVLAGIPMEEAAGHLDAASEAKELGKPWREADRHWEAWEEHREWLEGRVRSMSGRTRRLLGAPTREWIDGQG